MSGWLRWKSKKGERAPKRSERLLQANTSLSTDDVSGGYEQYGLSPPKGKHYVSEEKAYKRIEKDVKFMKKNYSQDKDFANKVKKAFKKGGDETDRKKLIFLYGRGFMWDKGTNERVDHVMQMLQGGEASERLLRVLETNGDVDLISSVEGADDTYKKHYKKHAMALKRYFSLDETFGFLDNSKDDNSKDAEFYFRIQSCGNCFITAPCVMVSYLIQKRAETNQELQGFEPLDVNRYVRRSFSDMQLFNYVVNDDGGASEEVLQLIVQHLTSNRRMKCERFNAETLRHEMSMESLQEKMILRGPGLISGFEVTKTFERASELYRENQDTIGIVRFDYPNDKGKFIPLLETEDNEKDIDDIESILSNHDCSSSSSASKRLFHREGAASNETAKSSKNTKHVTGEHAMVLLGGRRDAANPKKKYLLLQNWWEDLPLVEVSDDYLKGAGANIVFVPTRAIRDFDHMSGEKKDSYPRCSSLLAETNNIDRGEGNVWSTRAHERSSCYSPSMYYGDWLPIVWI